LAGSAIGIWSGMIGAALVQYIPETQFAPDKIIPRLLALGGLGAIYVLLTQTLDSALNQSLQYACVLLVGITLVRFIQAQIPKAR
jgi:hypothetical protein